MDSFADTVDTQKEFSRRARGDQHLRRVIAINSE